MGRIRTVKPELARHRLLFEMEMELGVPLRFIWAMLPTVCDRNGVFRWRPWDLKLDIVPYDEGIDFGRVLDALATRGFLVKYACATELYGMIPTFSKHQVVNNREKNSGMPMANAKGATIINVSDTLLTRQSREGDASPTRLVGKGKEGKGRELTTTAAPAENFEIVIPEASPVPGTEMIFEILPELSDPRINEVLQHIDPGAQKRWLKAFGHPKWIKNTLDEAISFYSRDSDALKLGWPQTLHKALYRAKTKAQGHNNWPPREELGDEFFNSLELVGGE